MEFLLGSQFSGAGQGVIPRPWEGAIAARVTHNQTLGPQNGTSPEQGWQRGRCLKRLRA